MKPLAYYKHSAPLERGSAWLLAYYEHSAPLAASDSSSITQERPWGEGCDLFGKMACGQVSRGNRAQRRL